MKQLINKYRYIALFLIVLMGLFLRFYGLGSNPPSLNWDEASTGYNAYSILKTGKDEYGNFLPLSIRSFDDYKPPLYTYLDVPFIGLFGLNEAAVRLPSAILGTLTVPLIYFLIIELFRKRKVESGNADVLGLVGAFFFAISPWSLQFSRAAYEGNIGLFFLVGALLFFLQSLRNQKLLPVSSVFFMLSMYSYHSFRLVIPVLFLFMAPLFYKELLKMKTMVVACLLLFAILVIPIFYSFIAGSSGTGARLSMVTLFGPSPNLEHSINQLEYDKTHHDLLGEILHNRRIVYFLAVTKGYLDHYNPDFLFLHGDGGRQHHAVDMGMMYLLDLPLLFLGVLVFFRDMDRKKWLLAGFLFAAPLPSAITTGTPHPVRAIAMLPPLIILSGVGVIWLGEKVFSIEYSVLSIKMKNSLIVLGLLMFAFNLVYYFHQYYVHTPLEYGDFWQYGYKDALSYAKQHENEFQNIVITYKYDQPYVYYLFYNRVDPSWYQQHWNFTGTGEMPRFERKIGKYDFRNIHFGDDQKMKDTLFIGAPDEIPQDKTIKTIYFLNGVEAFRIAKT
ncbi:MAG: ArnT family glycosyltransferase [Candidatus Levyibacteriota bacterium]